MEHIMESIGWSRYLHSVERVIIMSIANKHQVEQTSHYALLNELAGHYHLVKGTVFCFTTGLVWYSKEKIYGNSSIAITKHRPINPKCNCT